MSADTKPIEETTVDDENNPEVTKNYEVDEDEVVKM